MSDRSDSEGCLVVLGIPLAILSGITCFFCAWIYCSVSYGFLFGFGLGWLPSALLGLIVGVLTFIFLAPAAIGICALIAFYLYKNMPEVLAGIIIIVAIGTLYLTIKDKILTWRRNRPKRSLLEDFTKRRSTQHTEIVRCSICGSLNRIRAYSVTKAPICGRCQNELPEMRMIRVGRWFRQNETKLGVIVAILFIALGVSQAPMSPHIAPSGPLKPPEGFEIVCQAYTEIKPDVYRLYGLYSTVKRPARLTVRTAKGADYFIKLEDTQNGTPVMSFFTRGGEVLDIDVPLGSFIFKYAEGQTWCNEHDLFGEETAVYKAKDIFDFKQEITRDGYSTTHWTVELIPRMNGNLRSEPIGRSAF